MTAAERAQRALAADALCQEAFEKVGCPEAGVALVAVGGYGREELAPYSDLDVLLVHDAEIEVGDWAGQIWYPLWDSGANIDHAVRSFDEVLGQAAADLKVALGLLDARHLAGDPNVTLRLRTAILTAWRRDAKERLRELNGLVRDRNRLLGELAHVSVPDIKEATGGLRDAVVLKALMATWLVDVPHAELEGCRQAMLDVRDALHTVAGRGTDRISPEYWADMAPLLDLPDAAAVQLHVRSLGRRLTHVSRLAWRRVDAVLRRPAKSPAARKPQLTPIADGLAIAYEEVVLDRDAKPSRDPLLLLRAAAEAAERDLVLEPSTAARLVAEVPPLPVPWPAEARDLLVRLLAAGRGLLPVWETLDETGALAAILPEWERVRLLPHASVVHRFTVDRHLVETCIEASALIRRVSRPDVLMIAALLHDIGKGQVTEHSVAGEPIAREIAARIGFDARETELVAGLVRWHLLLPETATTRDPEDPVTVALVTERINDREELELLAALTEADARATSEKAWTTWRASLIKSLVRRASVELTENLTVENQPRAVEVPALVRADPREVGVAVVEAGDGSTVTVMSGDRVGLLADAAAMLALQRVSVRAARAWTDDGIGISEWQVSRTGLDATVMRERLEAIAEGRLDPADRLRTNEASALAPIVVLHPEASERASVIEVRAADRPGVVYLVCATLAGLGHTVASAHVDTLGPQAVDVFYVQGADGGGLDPAAAAAAADAIRVVLSGPGGS
ncbi:[protein-PII] uridylyltransferase [Nocardioides marmoriginsengisoli]|uniref:Bifunctional uridylyltransferase/uridylyl-removing enzyme n=1 Tax=Nocardioides marmoriginsengisoli TaxID=661483 RepID=A0A3N0CNU9_9ACTN|nr:[protein-PII] uridylyltransferase [Nocardioides marmoriginsengisoli]RNL65138.1 [protein-PII] uridylyltransferase [Nocardioides marmoriginsengisoli]